MICPERTTPSWCEEIQELLRRSHGVEVKVDHHILWIVHRPLDPLRANSGLRAVLLEALESTSPEIEI